MAPVTEARRRELALDLGRLDALPAALQDEAADGAAVELGPDHQHVGDRRVGDPHLGARELVAAGHGHGARLHAAGIGAVVGLGEAEAADPLAGGELGQVLHALLFGAVGIDRMHDQRGLHAHRRAVARIDALDLARHQAVGRVVGGGAAVFLGQGRAQQAERAELVHDLAVELLVPVGLQHARHQLVLAVVAGRVADRDLLLGELVVEEERVLPVERLGIGADALGGAFHRCGGGGHVCSWRCPPGLIRQCRPRQPCGP